ncbi:MAG: hypothetical protein QG673_1328 [Pseudomonadota bacterium]|nr:hypothetical protein [Pseudomonadota bacterium]
MDAINVVKLSGRIVKVYPVKHTLHQIPVLSFVLEHLSNQAETNEDRTIKCRVYCIMFNCNNSSSQIVEESYISVTGFLSQNSKSQLVLNVKNVKQIYE